MVIVGKRGTTLITKLAVIVNIHHSKLITSVEANSSAPATCPSLSEGNANN